MKYVEYSHYQLSLNGNKVNVNDCYSCLFDYLRCDGKQTEIVPFQPGEKGRGQLAVI